MAQYWYDRDPVLRAYHDNEWGKPHHEDQGLFELMSLEILQAGLNWQLVLKKRAAFNATFHRFDPSAVAVMTEAELDAAMQDQALIRNRRKLNAIVQNAQATLRIQQEFGSLDTYLWGFVNHQPLVHAPATQADVPSASDESRALAKDMKQRGFSFIGPVTAYSYMQGAGLIDDHLRGEARGKE
ncbi:DNA-3-methyladenine glycosylase I [Lacticaseibacillus mingshuiensis]|uniref:DNA-3-methyladenine glycosylase I n=1 Tax=Lacticaseibacillus mingshuiensis TaxID=2799574 RepID=A0ABW4CGS0_9LACO|nr:DNA-3-methyladenine glycosylase I [Lacticaseibacillus mingshuiensis]